MLEINEGLSLYAVTQENYRKGLFKKVFTLTLDEHLLQEWYVDSRTGKAVVLQWNGATKDPAIYMGITEEEWKAAWKQYVVTGRHIKEDKEAIKQMEKEKTWAVESIQYSPSEVLALKRWECVKFIMKDRRLK